MFGVIYYTVAGRYENGVYKKISLMNILVKFGSIRQYANCDFSMNTLLKPFIDELINSKKFSFETNVTLSPNIDVKWSVDDVIARRSFFIWENEHELKPHIDVSEVVFPKARHWVLNDSMFSTFMKKFVALNSQKSKKPNKKRKIVQQDIVD